MYVKKTFSFIFEKVFLLFEKYNYILAVVLLPLQHDFSALPDLSQQVFPFAHFFFFPPSAKVTPVTNKAAVANKNTFFIFVNLFSVNNQRENKGYIAISKEETVKI